MAIITRTLFVAEDEKVCCNCKYFVQFYTLYSYHQDNFFTACNAGYCVQKRMKNRKPKQKVCEHFEQKNGDGNV